MHPRSAPCGASHLRVPRLRWYRCCSGLRRRHYRRNRGPGSLPVQAHHSDHPCVHPDLRLLLNGCDQRCGGGMRNSFWHHALRHRTGGTQLLPRLEWRQSLSEGSLELLKGVPCLCCASAWLFCYLHAVTCKLDGVSSSATAAASARRCTAFNASCVPGGLPPLSARTPRRALFVHEFAVHGMP